MRNKNFLLVLGCFTLVYTVYGGVGFIINTLLVPLGYSTNLASVPMTFVLIGTFSVMATGIFLDRTKKYKLTL